VRHMFERRVGLYPMIVVPHEDHYMFMTNTYLGDYPHKAPGKDLKVTHLTDHLAGWWLLSYNKNVEASSTADGFPTNYAVNEDIRTWWSATTGGSNEWIIVDLDSNKQVNAIQINWGEQGCTALDRLHDAQQYIVDVSPDQQVWRTIIDKSANKADSPHDYTQLESPVNCRYVRIRNVHCPCNASFSVSGLRVFGSGMGKPPAKAPEVLSATRNSTDTRSMSVTWEKLGDVTGYVVRWGVKGHLYANFQVYGDTSLTIHSLNVAAQYLVTVDAFNENGVTLGKSEFPLQ